MLVKPCILTFNCPGDSGETFALFKGEFVKVSKSDPLIKLYGAIDTALSSIFYAANFLDSRQYRKQARITRLVGFALFNISFFIATENGVFIDRSITLFNKAVKTLLALNYKMKRGWVVCNSLECSVLDRARTDIRWAERRLVQTPLSHLVKYFNLASNIIFETMLSTPHIIYRT